MTDGETDRLEGLLIGLLVGLHTAGTVYRWVRDEKKDAAWHLGCVLIEGAAWIRHRRKREPL